MRHQLKLAQVVKETSDVQSFQFKPGSPMEYQAGQFLKYFLPHPTSDERGVSRYFTISAAPHEGFMMISTKFVPGDGSSFKQALLKLQLGDSIEAEGPRGDFTYPDPSQPAVFIAGGIGITPYRSILLDLDQKNLNAPITLVYANRTTDVPFKKLFDDLARKHDQLKVDYITGLLTEDILKSYLHPPSSILHPPVYYLSGPEPMVESLKATLEKLGLPSRQIKTDYFPGYEDEYTLPSSKP